MSKVIQIVALENTLATLEDNGQVTVYTNPIQGERTRFVIVDGEAL